MNFQAKGVQTVDFAKKLMGQIVFLYFLQKKGWLGVAQGKDVGHRAARFAPSHGKRRIWPVQELLQ